MVLSRPDDISVGSCVDARAEAANSSGADVVVSIHADGAAAGAEGFHVCYSAPPLKRGAGRPVRHLCRNRCATHSSQPDSPRRPTSVTTGWHHAPILTGLNLSQRPSILVELGNMRNADEAARMTSPDGQQEYASAVTSGVTALPHNPLTCLLWRNSTCPTGKSAPPR